MQESKRRLGYVELDISFVEASRDVLPAVSIDTGASLLGSATGLVSAAVGLFAGLWSGTGSGAEQTAVAQVASVGEALGGLIPLGGSSVAEANHRQAVEALSTPAPGLLADGAALARMVADGFGCFCRAVGEEARVEADLSGLAGFTAYTPMAAPQAMASETARTEAANGAALTRLVRQIALAERARVARAAPLASRDDARALEERIAADISAEADVIADLPAISDADDAVFRALGSLKAIVVSHLEARAASLEPLVAYRQAGPVSDLALAYALYGTIGADGARAAEVSARNKAVHPGFMPESGQALAA